MDVFHFNDIQIQHHKIKTYASVELPCTLQPQGSEAFAQQKQQWLSEGTACTGGNLHASHVCKHLSACTFACHALVTCTFLSGVTPRQYFCTRFLIQIFCSISDICITRKQTIKDQKGNAFIRAALQPEQGQHTLRGLQQTSPLPG